MPSILPKLYQLYQQNDLFPLTGYSPQHMHYWVDAPFTRFLKGAHIVGNAGLSLFEIMFLEGLAAYLDPKNILVVGNAHGWATVGLALIFPGAKVLGIDPDDEGNAITNAVAKSGALNLVAAKGYSPQDVGALCQQYLSGPADVVLIDAIHSNEAVAADYVASSAMSRPDAVMVFHDIINLNMVAAFNEIRAESALASAFLTRTPSGMGILYPSRNAELAGYVKCFSDDPKLFAAYRNYVAQTHVAGRQEAAIAQMT